MVESCDSSPEALHGVLDWLGNFVQASQPRTAAQLGMERSPLFIALTATEFPDIINLVRLQCHGLDATDIKKLAKNAVNRAEQLNDDSRPRNCIRALLFAIALRATAGDLSELGSLLSNLGLQFSKIRDFFRASLIQEVALAWKRQRRPLPGDVARAFWLLADIQFTRGDYDNCLKYVEEGLKVFDSPNLPPLRDKARRAIAVKTIMSSQSNEPAPIASLRLKFGKIDPALQDLTDLADAARTARAGLDSSSVARAEIALAEHLHVQLTMYLSAAEHFKEAARFAELAGEFDTEAAAMERSAHSLWELGEFAKAEADFEIALSLRRRLASNFEPIITGVSLALVQLSGGRREQGRETLAHVLSQSECVELNQSLAHFYLAVGIQLRQEDFIVDAIAVFELAIARFGAIPSWTSVVSRFYSELARCHFVQAEYERAIGILDDAIEHALKVGDRAEVARYYTNMAWAYHHLGSGDAAMRAIDLANRNAEGVNDASLRDYISDTSVEVMTRVGQLKFDESLAVNPTLADIGGADHIVSLHILEAEIAELYRSTDPKNRFVLVMKLYHMAIQLDRAGKFKESVRAFLRALAVARAQGVNVLRGSILHDLGVAYARQRNIRLARRAFAASILSKKRFSEGAGATISLIGLANCEHKLQNLSHVKVLLAEIIQQYEKERKASATPELTDVQLVDVANLYVYTYQPHPAKLLMQSILPTVRKHVAREDLIIALQTASRAELACGNWTEAEQFAIEALNEARDHAARISEQYRSEWQRYTMPIVDLLLSIYTKHCTARAQEALTLLESVKAMSLRAVWGRSYLAPPPDFPADLRIKETELIRTFETQEWLVKEAVERHKIFNFRRENQTRDALREFWRTLPRAWKHYADLRSGNPPDLETVLRLYPRREPVHFVWMYPASDQFVDLHPKLTHLAP